MLDNRPMPSPTNSRRWFRSVCASALLIALFSAVAAAQAPEVGSLRAEFPPASIDSVERAEAALGATAGAKGRVEKEYRSDARACMKTFMVNDCLDQARALQRKRLAEIESVELEANRYKRKDRADRTDAERARREAERIGNQKADAELRARNRANFDSKKARGQRDDAAKTESLKNRKPTAKRTPPVVPPNEATLRAKNAAEYASKVSAAKTHQVEINRRIAIKAAERSRRAEDKAAKDAKNAAAPVKP
jgi:hypothetical protein